MPRKKTLSDDDLLERALHVMRRAGPDGVTFASVAAETGLSPATLVQRFGTKSALLHAALVRAWEMLDERTMLAIDEAPAGPAGAVALLVALSGSFSGDADYAEGLLVLREDMRNPDLRARGMRWGTVLAEAVGERLADATGSRLDLGRLMIAQWQGIWLWWGFARKGALPDVVRQELTEFCRAIGRGV